MVYQVVLATPLNSNTVRVYLSEEPRHFSPLSDDDALNRLDWTISITAGGNDRVLAPVVGLVENAQARPTFSGAWPGAWSVDLRLDRRLVVSATYLVVAGPSLRSVAGNSMSASPLDRDDFPGDVSVRLRRAAIPKTVRSGIDFLYDTIRGVFALDSKGDIDVHEGDDALKKRIVRRLLTSPGGFFHLPGYGVGLETKKLYDQTAAADLRAKVEEQVRQEQEVAKVAVAVTTGPGVVFVQVGILTRSKKAISISVEIPEDGRILIAA